MEKCIIRRMGYPKVQIQDAFLHLQTKVTYRLIGAILHHHIGSNSGHYSCYFMDRVQDTWFYANDDKVHTIAVNYIGPLRKHVTCMYCRLHQSTFLKCLPKTHICFCTRCMVRFTVVTMITCIYIPYTIELYTEGRRPNALSVIQCERIRNNQWLTDEVRKPSIIHI